MKDDFTRAAIPESSLSMLIAAARRHVKHAVSIVVEPYGINAYQCWMVLLLKERGPMSLSELAGRMWMDHPTTSRLVHALEGIGLLQVQPDPSHGRKVLISVHPGKTEAVEDIQARVAVYRARMESGLGSDEKEVLHRALARMIMNLRSLLDEEEGGKQNQNLNVAPRRDMKASLTA